MIDLSICMRNCCMHDWPEAESTRPLFGDHDDDELIDRPKKKSINSGSGACRSAARTDRQIRLTTCSADVQKGVSHKSPYSYCVSIISDGDACKQERS